MFHHRTEDYRNDHELQVKPLDQYLFFYVIAALCEQHGLCFGLFLCDMHDLYCMGSLKEKSQASELKIDQAVSQNQEVHMTLLLLPLRSAPEKGRE